MSFQHWRWLAHCFVLWSLAVAQPLYSKIAENLPFLLAHEANAADIVWFALAILIPAPILIWALVRGAWRVSPPFGRLLRFGSVWALVALALLPLLRAPGIMPSWVCVLLAIGLAWLPAWFYAGRVWSGLLDMLTPAPVVFILYFLIWSPVGVLVLPQRDAEPVAVDQRADVPVVLVMLDEFPSTALLDESGAIDTGRYPGFARLAGMSTWYPRATTVSDATVMAVPAFLTGIMPVDERRLPPVYQNYPDNLFDLLGPRRTVWATENGTRMCRPQWCREDGIPDPGHNRSGRIQAMLLDAAIIWGHIALPNTLRNRLPAVGTRWAGFTGNGPGLRPEFPARPENGIDMRWERRHVEFEAFIERLEKLVTSALYYHHALLPHAPWIRLPGGQIYDLPRSDSVAGIVPDTADAEIKHLWYDDEAAVTLGQQRFLLQAGYVDGLIDRVLDALETSGHLDDALLVVTADHGGAFTAGASWRAVSTENLAEIAGIPLFIKFPGQESGRTDRQPVSLLDVAPTLLAVLGEESRLADPDGEVLVSLDRGDEWTGRVVNDKNEVYEFAVEEFDTDFQRALRAKHRRFVFSPARSFPRWREYSEWYGRPVSAWSVVDGPDDALIMRARGLWRDVNPDAAFLPIRLHGTLHIDRPGEALLVAALNGRIAGVTKPYSYPGAEGDFELLLDPEFLAGGRNELLVYLHRPDDPDSALQKLYQEGVDPLAAPRYDRAAQLLYLPGREAPVHVREGSPPFGAVSSHHEPERMLITLSGWAADTLTGLVADEVHIFVGGQWMGSTAPGIDQPHLVERYGLLRLEGSGYRFALPLDAPDEYREDVLTVIAVDELGRAGELSYLDMNDPDWPFAIVAEYRRPLLPRPPWLESRDKSAFKPGHWYRMDDSTLHDAIELHGAWYAPHHGIRWMGADAGLSVDLHGLPATEWQLEIMALAFVHPEYLPKQDIRLDVNGETVTHWVMTQPGVQRLQARFSIPAGKTGDISIRLVASDPVSPLSLGLSEDGRALSLAWQKFRLSPVRALETD